MIRTLNIDGVTVSIIDESSRALVNRFCNSFEEVEGQPQVGIQNSRQGLICTWYTAPGGPLHYSIDVEKFSRQYASYPAPKRGALNQALGRKTRAVIDATAGWGSDALLMCAQGFTVTLLERNPIMALLLEDAMTRFSTTGFAQKHQIPAPLVMQVDAIDFLSKPQVTGDCVYLDPMFPPKRKKSAAVNKYIQFLQWLVGEDQDAVALASNALGSGCSRVVVKRPDYALPLLEQPSQQFSSKLVHYDVYLSTA
ncbi:MAG: class I SAM-dependent methyltransferase [Gammaproteobacteria bacterium]|nr:class I SAM-dependent methyltransferase [Gammaproteobacteria bacterium]